MHRKVNGLYKQCECDYILRMLIYKKDATNGNWLLTDSEDGEIICQSADLVIAYTKNEDSGLCSLLKHGSAEDMKIWSDNTLPVYQAAKLDPPIIVEISPSASADQINFLMDHSLINEEKFTKLSNAIIDVAVIDNGPAY